MGLAIWAALLCAEVQSDIHAKLLTPIASYSKPGQDFEIRVGLPVEFGAAKVLPEGSVLRGKVRVAQGVGIGLRRERAHLELEFEPCTPAPCSFELLEIENAREPVGKGNRIQGIRAASNPNSLLQGIWFRPAGAFLHRSPTGLTGPVGALQSRLAPHPAGAAATIAFRLLLFSLPNAEIELPAGTELILRVKGPGPTEPAELPPTAVLTEIQSDSFQAIPSEIKSAAGNLVADRIHIIFRGTRKQIESAFGAAGWTTADPLTRRSFAKSYAAFTSLRGYPTAPVYPLYHQRNLPEFVLQKSFNTIAKRHHIRFWRMDDPSCEGCDPLWAAAATHDVSIAFDWSRMALTHRVDEFLDAERSKVLNDLWEARCLQNLNLLDRPELAGTATDGRLAVVGLKPCRRPDQAAGSQFTLRRPGNPAHKRLARRLVLETRQYLIRGNAYYWAYRGIRKTVAGIRGPVEVVSRNAVSRNAGNGLR